MDWRVKMYWVQEPISNFEDKNFQERENCNIRILQDSSLIHRDLERTDFNSYMKIVSLVFNKNSLHFYSIHTVNKF